MSAYGVVEAEGLCSRCGGGLTSYWVFVKDGQGKVTGQAACGGCAREGEKPGTRPKVGGGE